MAIKVQAVYEGGVLRPLQQLALHEGETVEVTVVKTRVDASSNAGDVSQRLLSARTIAEWVEATKLLPSDDGGYDILKALNNNRRWSGEGPLTPDNETPPSMPT
jgi:predicted DNA-binding antitoxin AbrB/MazE fold protein